MQKKEKREVEIVIAGAAVKNAATPPQGSLGEENILKALKFKKSICHQGNISLKA